MKLHNLIQGSPEWLAYRAQHRNASDAPAMMGVSPYKSRAELLREIHTGVTPEVDVGTQRRYDNGHRAEALARPLAEEFIGQELYPVTASVGNLSASFDGLTMDGLAGFEHKALNNELRKAFAMIDSIAPKYREELGCRELPIYHRVQMEQQLLISGAERVLFMASQWAGEELVEEQHCWYYPDAALRESIVAGWDQFEKDLQAYVVPEAVDPPPVGKAPEMLPALRIEVTGQVTASNLAEFKKTALDAIASVNRELTTDQHFADAEKSVKWCEDIEARIKASKEHALSQTASIDMLFKAMDDISNEARTVRLDLKKLIDIRKTQINEEAVAAARAALFEHLQALNAELAPAVIAAPAADFAGAIKGLRSIASKQDALDSLLAKTKIALDTTARGVRANQAAFKTQAAGFEHLFPDLAVLALKQPEDFAAGVSARIAQHKEAEAKRQEQERERIRAEELQRIENERLAAEKAKQQSQVEAAAPAPAPAAAAAPAPAPVRSSGTVRRAPAAEPATLKLGVICERLGFTVGADFLEVLGFVAHKDRSARLYREGDFKAICAAIRAHVQAVEEHVTEAA